MEIINQLFISTHHRPIILRINFIIIDRHSDAIALAMRNLEVLKVTINQSIKILNYK